MLCLTPLAESREGNPLGYSLIVTVLICTAYLFLSEMNIESIQQKHCKRG